MYCVRRTQQERWLAMNSLLEREGMVEQFQMAYIDPPYGTCYGSSFQPPVNKRDVTDEMRPDFRDRVMM